MQNHASKKRSIVKAITYRGIIVLRGIGLSGVSNRGSNKIEVNLRRMQQRIVNQAFANSIEEPFLMSFFDHPWW